MKCEFANCNKIAVKKWLNMCLCTKHYKQEVKSYDKLLMSISSIIRRFQNVKSNDRKRNEKS